MQQLYRKDYTNLCRVSIVVLCILHTKVDLFIRSCNNFVQLCYAIRNNIRVYIQ